ncbi:hypothetical protein J4E91_008736 [Alternaria rosae]|nr:hypothetical protein J4E91_008736 [Alternaria rosae]
MSSVLSLEIARSLFPSLTKDASPRSSSTESIPSSTKVDAKSQIKIKVSEDVKSRVTAKPSRSLPYLPTTAMQTQAHTANFNNGDDEEDD